MSQSKNLLRSKSSKAQHMVVLYTKNHLSSGQIGKLLGCCRQYVIRTLKANGVDTSKGVGTQVKVNCGYCAAEFSITRSRWRSAKKHYCCDQHYYATRENPSYDPWRQGQRIARDVVSQHFKLEKGNIVHHVDTNNRNNNLDNLWVFEDQSAHLSHHHGNPRAKPIWRGSDIDLSTHQEARGSHLEPCLTPDPTND